MESKCLEQSVPFGILLGGEAIRRIPVADFTVKEVLHAYGVVES